MEPTTIDRGALSPELQERLQSFDSSAAKYQALQERFSTTRKETQRLLATAEALDAETEQANQSWKEMAKAETADQRKINAEIERGVKSKAEADKHRHTAQTREELHGEISISLAEARLRLQAEVGPLNRTYRQERIETLLATEGLGELLAEVYALIRDERRAEMTRTGLVTGPQTIGDLEDQVIADRHVFGRYLVDHLEKSGAVSKAITVADVPKPVAGEIIASGMASLKVLRDNGGHIPANMSRMGVKTLTVA